MFSRCERLRDEAGAGEVLEVPLWCALCFPCPENPAGMRFIRIELCFDIVLQVGFVDGQHVVDSAGGLVIAATVIRRLWECVIVSGSLSESVQPLRAIGLGAGPLANNGPFVGTGEWGCVSACILHVFAGLAADFLVGEDLVDVRVEDRVIDTAPGGSKSIPR